MSPESVSLGEDKPLRHFISAGTDGVAFRRNLSRISLPWGEVESLRILEDPPLLGFGKGDPRLWIITTSGEAQHVPLWQAFGSGRARRREEELNEFGTQAQALRTAPPQQTVSDVPVVADWRMQLRPWRPTLQMLVLAGVALGFLISGQPLGWVMGLFISAAVLFHLWTLFNTELGVGRDGVTVRRGWSRGHWEWHQIGDPVVLVRPFGGACVAAIEPDGTKIVFGERQMTPTWRLGQAHEIARYIESAERTMPEAAR